MSDINIDFDLSDFRTVTTETAISPSKASCFFRTEAIYEDGHSESDVYVNDVTDGKKLVLPVGTRFIRASFCTVPDIHMLVVHSPSHHGADRHGLIGVILRNASWTKLMSASQSAE